MRKEKGEKNYLVWVGSVLPSSSEIFDSSNLYIPESIYSILLYMMESADQTESEWHDRVRGLQSISSFNKLPKGLKSISKF